MAKVWTDERVERLIALLEERQQNKSLFHPTTSYARLHVNPIHFLSPKI